LNVNKDMRSSLEDPLAMKLTTKMDCKLSSQFSMLIMQIMKERYRVI
jgi:hypothetical protein